MHVCINVCVNFVSSNYTNLVRYLTNAIIFYSYILFSIFIIFSAPL